MKTCDHATIWIAVMMTWTCAGPCSLPMMTTSSKVNELEEKVRQLEAKVREVETRGAGGRGGP